MKKISIVTNEDLTNIRNKIGYYFEGGTGFISRKLGLSGNQSYLKDYDYIKIAQKIESADINDKIELEEYIQNRIVSKESEILALQDKIKSIKSDIKNLDNHLIKIKNLSSFEQSFNYLADEKSSM